MRFDDLRDVVSDRILTDAMRTSELLTRLGVRHALIGGLAVGVHGHPRATKDVDYLVGNEGFASVTPLLVLREELLAVMRVGVIDLLSVDPRYPALEDALAVPKDGDIPVIPVEALVLMKLDANRPHDLADVGHLVRAGADVMAINDYLKKNARSLTRRFRAVLAMERG